MIKQTRECMLGRSQEPPDKIPQNVAPHQIVQLKMPVEIEIRAAKRVIDPTTPAHPLV